MLSTSPSARQRAVPPSTGRTPSPPRAPGTRRPTEPTGRTPSPPRAPGTSTALWTSATTGPRSPLGCARTWTAPGPTPTRLSGDGRAGPHAQSGALDRRPGDRPSADTGEEGEACLIGHGNRVRKKGVDPRAPGTAPGCRRCLRTGGCRFTTHTCTSQLHGVRISYDADVCITCAAPGGPSVRPHTQLRSEAPATTHGPHSRRCGMGATLWR
jgi:hypothetical protein